jgi:hypothetical protein
MTNVRTAKDQAIQEGHKTVKDRIHAWSVRSRHLFVDDRTAGNPVYARIDWGRWIADCECGGAEYVDPDEPLFFCMSCGNKVSNGRARKVEFPKDRSKIETETMKQPEGGARSWKRGDK